jgi:hypothetical protein
MSTPNWGKLYREGRVKAIGVPFNDKELEALHKLEIPAEYVRDGILSKEDYEKTLAADEKKGRPLTRMSRQELLNRATELDITDFTNATTDDYLRIMITEAEDKKPKKATKKAAPKKAAKKVAKKKVAKKVTKKK